MLLCTFAGLDPSFDVGGAADDLFNRQGLYPRCEGPMKVHATRLCGKGYVSLAKADHPWPCALIEHCEWVSSNLFDLEPPYFALPMPGQHGRDGKIPTAPDPEIMNNPSPWSAHYRMVWEKTLHAPPSA